MCLLMSLEFRHGREGLPTAVYLGTRTGRSCVWTRQMCSRRSPLRAKDLVHLLLTPLRRSHPCPGQAYRRCAKCLFLMCRFNPYT